ncbi:MAG TPA: hypothetical protein DDZ81_21710 [Acetobacteraceae bacterium]|jgi:glutathione S-transferase|nr:hypothetical protein [Acetobacteraceae bacterium]
MPVRTVERALYDKPHYIIGRCFTAAGVLLSTCITWAVRYGVPVADIVLGYHQRATARPAFARARQTNAIPDQ